MRKKLIYGMVIVAFLLPVILAACAGPAPTGPEKVTWRHQCAYDSSDKEYITLTNFIDAITLATGGNFEIQTFPAETVVPTEELLSAVAEGVVEVGHAAGGYWKGVVPVANIEQGLPGQYTGTLEEWHELQYDYAPNGRTLEEIYREAYAKQGVFHLGSHSYDSYPAVFSAVPIHTLSDYDGVIVRASGAPGDVFAAMGASVTWLPGAELYMALKLGTIDIATWSCEGLIGYKWYEVCKYVIMPPMSTHSMSHFIINQAVWDALSDDYKNIYETAYHDIYIPQLYAHYLAEWDKIYSMADSLGYEIIELSDADAAEMMRISMEEIWVDEAAKAPECKEALDIVKSYYGIS